MKKRILQVIPLIAVMLFLISGLYLENWKLGWSFFLLIPLSWILFTGNVFKRLNDLAPLVALIVFLWLGFGFDLWHPGWIVFLLIPLANMIAERRVTPRKLVTVVVLAAYVTVSLIIDQWHPTWIMLLFIPIINTLFFPYNVFSFKKDSNDWKTNVKKFFNDKITVEHEDDDDEDF
jgi:hypothetical protein